MTDRSVFDITGQNRSDQQLIDQLKGLKKSVDGPYSGGGGGGDMNERIARLEATMEHVQGNVSGLRSDMQDARERLISIEAKVDHIPTKWDIAQVVFFVMAALMAATIFGPRVIATLSSGS